MASLYEIDYQIKSIIDGIFDSVDENGEVMDPDFEALEALSAERKTKMENIGLYIKNVEAEAVAIKAEEENLAKRRKRLENKAERLRGLLIRSMTENNETDFSTARIAAKIKTTETTEILDIDQIPEEYIKVKTEYSADKTAIKKAIKAGAEIAGAAIKVNTKINIS